MSQATAGNRPTIESNVRNRNSALRFTTTQALTSTAAVALTSDATWFLVVNPLAAGNLFFIEQSTDTNSFPGTYMYGGNNFFFYTTRSGVGRQFVDASATPFPLNNWYVITAMFSNRSTAATDLYWAHNGIRRSGTTGSVISVSSISSNLYINPLARVPGSNYMGELIIYNRPLTYGEIYTVERYLADKWAVPLQAPHPYTSVPSALRLFNPLDISGLSTWFDAADTRRMTLSGSNVNSWGDKANLDNSMNFVGTAGTLVSNASNYPCVRFSGTSRYQSTLSNLTRAAYFSDVSTLTMFAVVNTSSTSGVNGLFWNFVSTTNVANRVAIFTTPPSTLFWDGGQQSSPRQTTGLTLTTNSMRLYMFRRSGITLSFRQFGTLTTSNFAVTIPTIANDAYRITMSESGAAWTGDMHEILWYNRALPDTDIWQLEVYLAEKWGLRSSLTTNVPPRFTRALSPVFTPVLISNCALWLDAADPPVFTFSSGSNVSVWRDKSGSNNNATTISGTPTYSSNRVTFSASRMDTALSSSVNTETGFVVLNMSGAGENTVIGASAPGFRSIQISENIIYTLKRDVVVYVQSLNNLPANTTTLLSYDFSSALWMNGSPNGTGSAASFDAGGTTRIANDSRGFAYSGEVMEIVIYQRILTRLERQLVEGYLAEKWNLATNLPNNHPYKTILV